MAAVIPLSTENQRVPAEGSPICRVTAAMHTTVTTPLSSAATNGHRSVSDPARLKPMKNSPNAAPETSPATTPAAWWPRALRLGCPSGSGASFPSAIPARFSISPAGPGLTGSVLTDTAAMAGSANAIPASAAALGRSPNSKPASTANAAAPTALTELATLHAAYLNPRYSAIAPTTPPTPARAPHTRDRDEGAWLLTNGTTATSSTVAVTSATTVTRTTLGPRDASPAA